MPETSELSHDWVLDLTQALGDLGVQMTPEIASHVSSVLRQSSRTPEIEEVLGLTVAALQSLPELPSEWKFDYSLVACAYLLHRFGFPALGLLQETQIVGFQSLLAKPWESTPRSLGEAVMGIMYGGAREPSRIVH